MIADPDVEVVYNPLANSLHAQATLAPWAGGPPRLVTARGGARHGAPEVDEWLDADLAFPGGATGSARCHMAHEEYG